MDKCRTSRKQLCQRFGRGGLPFAVIATALIAVWPEIAQAFALSNSDALKVGKRVWQNECGGTISGLTSWNQGEDFASLGIGHFIWYPKGRQGPFEESFPKLAKFLSSHGAKTASWMNGDCPWNSRAEFQAQFQSERMNEVRALLFETIRLQSRFLVQRMKASLPKMLAEAPAAQRDNVRAQFQRMLSTSSGTFALIDYVNFKGEGTNPAERYKGEGWGLLQVLAGMHGTGAGAPKEFAASAAANENNSAIGMERHRRWVKGRHDGR